MSLFKSLFQSKEHKVLEASIVEFIKVHNDNKDHRPALANVVANYSEKGADSFLALPTATQDHKNILSMVSNTVKAQQALSSKNDREFQSCFDGVLMHRTQEASPIVFSVSNTLARQLAQANQVPDTLSQTKALDKLSQHYFNYADAIQGPAGASNFFTGKDVAFNAARGYKRFGHQEESSQIYNVIAYKMGVYNYALTNEQQIEIDNSKPLSRKMNGPTP